VTQWPSSKARRVYAALLSVGWQLKRQSGSHRTLSRAGYPDYVFAFHDSDEIGPRMLARIAKHTGLTPDKL
jgi:predicted RNA binding protein YcfA (HicA-like mRNA interferase family)